MANVPFTALHDYVLPYLPGAEKPIVDSQIRKTLREFLQRTTLIREQFVVPTVPGTNVYRLAPVFGQVSSIISVHGPDNQLIGAIAEDRRGPVSPGEPRGWYTRVPDLLTFMPVPDAVYQFKAEAVITLKIDATEFPEELVAHYAEGISAGVLAAMMSMPGKPWSQTKAADAAGRMFAGTIRTVRGRLRDGGQPNNSTITAARSFGA